MAGCRLRRSWVAQSCSRYLGAPVTNPPCWTGSPQLENERHRASGLPSRLGDRWANERARSTNAIERLHEDATSIPNPAETAVVLFWVLLAASETTMRTVDRLSATSSLTHRLTSLRDPISLLTGDRAKADFRDTNRDTDAVNRSTHRLGHRRLLGGTLAGLIVKRERWGLGVARNLGVGLIGALIGGFCSASLGFSLFSTKSLSLYETSWRPASVRCSCSPCYGGGSVGENRLNLIYT